MKDSKYANTSIDRSKEERERLNRLNNMEKVSELNTYDMETSKDYTARTNTNNKAKNNNMNKNNNANKNNMNK